MQSAGFNPLGGMTEAVKGFMNEIREKILSNFEGDKIKEVLRTMEQGATEVAKQFGQGRENIVALQASMGDAVQTVTRMGGSFQSILNIQKEINTEIGRNVILQGEAFEKIFLTTKVTGVDADKLAKSFKDTGFSLYDTNKEMQKVVDVARQQGVSAQAVSDQVVKNMAALNKFGFENGVQGLAKMAAQATALRIDMNRTLTLADDLFSPEKAIDLAASLQRLGVAQSDLLDPLRLMDLAQNDPAELQNQIAQMSKQFVKLKEDGSGFEIMKGSQRQLKEIELAMGMTSGELSKMALASAELEDKMSKIIFPSSIASEEDRQMIANMSEMKDGKYEVTFQDKKGEKVTKAVTELDPGDVEQLKKASDTKTLEELAEEQLTTLELSTNILKSIETKLPTAIAGTSVLEQGRQATRGAYKVIGAATDTAFSNETLTKSLDKGITDLFKSAQEGKIIEGVMTSFLGLGEFMEKEMRVSFKDMDKSFKNLSETNNLFVDTIKSLVNQLKETVVPKQNTAKAQDFVLETLPEDTLRVKGGKIFGGTKLDETGAEPNKETTQNINVDGSITINLTSQGIDTTSLSMALNDMSVKQQIVQAVISGMNPNTNPYQMNQQIKSGERATYNFG